MADTNKPLGIYDARELGRPVRWNPATLCFDGDEEAHASRLYYYDYRNPYKLPYCQVRKA